MGSAPFNGSLILSSLGMQMAAVLTPAPGTAYLLPGFPRLHSPADLLRTGGLKPGQLGWVPTRGRQGPLGYLLWITYHPAARASFL